MGFLHYGADKHPIEIDDRTLAHLKVVVTTKLRRNESFTLTWKYTDDNGERRTALWLQPAIPLRFEYAATDTEVLDPDLLQQFAEAANTNAGIVVEWGSAPPAPADLAVKRAA